MLRKGDNPRLAPLEEQALLEKLRREREAKAHAALQAEAQLLALTLARMPIEDIFAEAKTLSKTKKALAIAPVDAQVALVCNTLLCMCGTPTEPEPAKKGNKKAGGKTLNAVKLAAAKVVEGPPPTGPEVRAVLKGNAHLLAEATNGTANGQLALLKALEAWLLCSRGVKALPSAAKILEVLYDKDLAEEEHLLSYWADVNARRTREAAELAESEATCAALSAEKAAAEEAVRHASREQADAAWHLKQAEQRAQNCRCGGSASREEEAAEKQSLSMLKKAIEYGTQMDKVLAARSKDLIEASAELEAPQRVLTEQRVRKEVGVELFAKNSVAFFEWLAEDDDDEDD